MLAGSQYVCTGRCQVLGDAKLALLKAAAGLLINPAIIKFEKLEALVDKVTAP